MLDLFVKRKIRIIILSSTPIRGFKKWPVLKRKQQKENQQLRKK